MSDATDQLLVDEMRAKLDAETAAARAEAELHSANALKAQADARKADADARSAELRAGIELLLLEHERREAARLAAKDERNRVYQFDGVVASSSVKACISKLTEWERLEPGCDVEIVFNSPGGSVIDGMALFDYLSGLRLRGHHVTTRCRGMAASMAGILLQAGDRRVIGPESYLMIHELSAGTSGKIGEIKDDVKFYETICARVVDIFVSRSHGKCSKARFIRSWARQDWWLTSAESLALGFVDAVE